MHKGDLEGRGAAWISGTHPHILTPAGGMELLGSHSEK